MPFQLKLLLDAAEAGVRDAAWDELIAQHTRLLLSVARSLGGGKDAAMDRYAYILEKLREDDFRRLRTFDEHRGARFSTWLTLTARRLCVDHARKRYGRQRDAETEDIATRRANRRHLIDGLVEAIEPDAIIDERASRPDDAIVRAETAEALRAALDSLDARARLLLALRFEDEHSASSIAGMLGLPSPFHVYRLLNGILAQLRARLAQNR